MLAGLFGGRENLNLSFLNMLKRAVYLALPLRFSKPGLSPRKFPHRPIEAKTRFIEHNGLQFGVRTLEDVERIGRLGRAFPLLTNALFRRQPAARLVKAAARSIQVKNSLLSF